MHRAREPRRINSNQNENRQLQTGDSTATYFNLGFSKASLSARRGEQQHEDSLPCNISGIMIASKKQTLKQQ